MKKLFLSVLCLIVALTTSAQVQHPKLIVGIVIDQMRWDYLYYYYDKFGENGLKRLLNEGFSCENTMLPYIPSVTAVGHSAIFSGTTPALSGIAGNYFAINDKYVYCCSDSTVKGLDSNDWDSQMSPRNMWCTTIGDELKISNDFKSKVIGIALKDRAAILPAGQSADAAYWWDQKSGHYVSSTYYMKQLPSWVSDFNKAHHTAQNFDIKTTTKLGVDYSFDLAEAALKNERLGQRDITDMLTLSVSSTDAIGHAFSTRGKENEEVYMELDKDLAEFLNTLDQTVGKGNYLLFLTADHGAVHNYNFMNKHNIPGGGWDYDATTKSLNKDLQNKFGIAPVMWEDNYQFFFNDSLIASRGLKKQDVIDESVKFLEKDPMFIYAVDNEHAAESTLPEILKQRLINGYNRQRSGEITVIPRAGYFGVDKPSIKYKGTSHGEWNPYDAHIPLIFMGWHIQHGETVEPVSMTDIAPTICAMLHVQMPNSCMGKAITAIVNQKE
nr:alkaline phosphatase family protein [uncultured Prevotella sp.]